MCEHECSIILSEPGSVVSVCVMEAFAAYHDVWSRLNLRKPKLAQVETALGCSAARLNAQFAACTGWLVST